MLLIAVGCRSAPLCSPRALLIWSSKAPHLLRFGWGVVGVVGAGGVLPGRHERKVQSGRLRVRLIFEGCDLKTLCSSRLAFQGRALPAGRLPIVETRAFARRSWAFACVSCAPRGHPG